MQPLSEPDFEGLDLKRFDGKCKLIPLINNRRFVFFQQIAFNGLANRLPKTNDNCVATILLTFIETHNPGIFVFGLLDRFENDMVLEGGSIDVNGRGLLLTSEQCLLNKNRNPQLSKQQIEQYLKDYYGQRHVCWLTGGIEGDDG